MKAIILVAGIGSRLAPLTDNSHKALLPIGSSTTLGLMVSKLNRHAGITDFVIVTGNREDDIKAYLAEHFPELNFDYVRNERYLETNTGYSLMVAEPFVQGETFIKLDGDVNFDPEIIERLVAAPVGASYICVDRTAVDAEVIKAQLDETGRVVRIGNTNVRVEDAAGESIGIERIDATHAPVLFDTLRTRMADPDKLKEYYEVSYDVHAQAGDDFRVVDITGLKWVEMDNHADYAQAVEHFGNN